MKATKIFKLLILFALGLIAQSIKAQGTFTEVHEIPCGDTMYISPLGYPTWNDPMILDYPQFGFGQLLGDFVAANILEYQAPSFISTIDTVVIQCAHATQITCDTGIYVFKVTCPLDTTTFNQVYTIPVECNDSIYSSTLSAWGLPQLTAEPTHGTAKIIMQPNDGAGIKYIPQPGFVGLDYATVSMFQGQTTVLYIFQVQCGISAVDEPSNAAKKQIKVYPNPSSDGTAIMQVASGGKLSAFTMDGKQITVNYTALGDEKIQLLGLGSLPKGIVVLQYQLGSEVYFAEYLVR